MRVEYHWKHVNHIPGSSADLATAPISRQARELIQAIVDQNMTWATIKSMLRVDTQSLVDIYEGDGSGIPAIMRIGYSHVYYAMSKFMNDHARLDDSIGTSLENWSTRITEEKGYSTYIPMDGDQSGMFLYAFLSQWQLDVSKWNYPNYERRYKLILFE